MSATIFLDFNGAPAQVWPSSPAVDAWGTPQQRAEVLARVREKFSPFDVTVTDVDPANGYPAGSTLRIIVAGNSNGSWAGSDANGGTSSESGFFPSTVGGSTSAWVFPSNLAEAPSAVAEASAHEIGHELGLVHQSVWGNGPLGSFVEVEPYNTGTTLAAPVMGSSYFAVRGLWWYGTSEFGPFTIQDDLALLTAAVGRRPYGHGQTLTSADPVNAGGQARGVIVDAAEHDVLSFSTAGGLTTVSVDVVPQGPTLHASLQLEDAAGDLLATAADPVTLGQSLTVDLPAGRYDAVVGSFGGYGDLGQYTLSVSGPGVPEPDRGRAAAVMILAVLLLRRPRRRSRPSTEQ